VLKNKKGGFLQVLENITLQEPLFLAKDS